MENNYIRLKDYKGYAIFRETLEEAEGNKYYYWVFHLNDINGDCYDNLMGNTLTETKRKIDKFIVSMK